MAPRRARGPTGQPVGPPFEPTPIAVLPCHEAGNCLIDFQDAVPRTDGLIGCPSYLAGRRRHRRRQVNNFSQANLARLSLGDRIESRGANN